MARESRPKQNIYLCSPDVSTHTNKGLWWTLLIIQGTPKILFSAMELRYFWFLCTLKHHQKSINTTEFIYRKLQLVKISFKIHCKYTDNFYMVFPQDLLQQHVQNIKLFFPSRISFIFPPVIQAKTQGSLPTSSSQSCLTKTCPSHPPAALFPPPPLLLS